MERQITGKGIVRDMEHLVRLLHKEWERSGRTKAEVVINPVRALEIEGCMARAVAERQKQLDTEEMTFKQSMALSKENFILLRLIRKIRMAEDRAGKKGPGPEFTVEFDKEEHRLFKKITGTAEG